MAASNGVSKYATHKWWKEANVYQIYPASFKSTGSGSSSGFGDLRGITSKLDYLKDLGIDVIWISPIYKSPQVDMGYDIADYKDIDEAYGTLEDVDELIAELQKRGMRLMMDLVVNHTSDQHDWFKDSRSSKTSSKRDWYIWEPPKYDKDGNRVPPNNWALILGEANSAWTWDEHTQEYYLSLFTPEQPDLNWRNPEVRAAVHDVLRFWLDRGASGFRMDVINLISKVDGFPDAPIINPNVPYQPGHIHYANGPRMHEYLREMRREVLNKYDSITVGEMPFVDDPEEVLQTVRAEDGELNMIFIFDLVDIDNYDFRLSLRDFTTAEVRGTITKWQTVMRERNGWNSVFIENHDNPRALSRFLDDSDQYRVLSAKLLALMETTLGGTLYIYQGQELGARNVPLSWDPEEYKDIETINFWKKTQALANGDEKKLAYGKKIIQMKARDHARVPVSWSAEANAGFCSKDIKPWMRVNDDYKTTNVEAQQKDSESVLQFYKDMMVRRKECKDAFVYGSFECLDDKVENVFAYRRRSEDGKQDFVVVLNFSGKDVQWKLPKSVAVDGWVLSNYQEAAKEGDEHSVVLRPWEARLGQITKP